MDDGQAVPITECPYSYIGHDVIDLIELIGHAEKHDWPVDGGVIRQTDNFRSAMRIWKNYVSQNTKK